LIACDWLAQFVERQTSDSGGGSSNTGTYITTEKTLTIQTPVWSVAFSHFPLHLVPLTILPMQMKVVPETSIFVLCLQGQRPFEDG
jgi:hypothetical protein